MVVSGDQDGNSPYRSLGRQAIEVLRELHPVTGSGIYVFETVEVGKTYVRHGVECCNAPNGHRYQKRTDPHMDLERWPEPSLMRFRISPRNHRTPACTFSERPFR